MILPGNYANGFAPRDGEPLFPELWRGCIGAWNPGLGPSGLTLRDWSPYKNHGLLTNGPTWQIDQGRYALNLDGTNDYVTSNLAPKNLTEITFSTWHFLRSIAGEMVFNLRPINTIANLFYFSNTLFLRGGSTTAVTLSASGLTSRWVHLAATISATNGTIFLNGVQVASGSVTAIGANATGLEIGAYVETGPGYYLDGQLSDLAIHNRRLSTNEIRILASRPGIAYEMIPSQLTGSEALIAAYRARQYSQIIGGGVI